MQGSRFTLLPLTCAVSLALGSLSAVANENATASNEIEKVTVTGNYTVSEVIDTATGLGLTLRETPQSVSVMTELRIQDQALDSIVDTVTNAVGVSSKEVDKIRHTIRARGFDVNSYQIDGVPLSWSLAGDSGETIVDVSIYERVEFVRGATGLLTGAGDPSGSINLVRKHADSSEFTGYVNAAIGSWNNRELTTDLASSLNQEGSVRGRIVAKYEDGESYEDLYENTKVVLYGVVEADLSSSTLLRVGASYQNNDPTAPTWGALPTFFTDGTMTDWDVSKTTAAQWTQWETTGTNFFANLHHQFSNGMELVINYNNLKYEQSTELLYLFGTLDKITGEGLSSWPYKSEGESKQDSFDMQLKGQYKFFDVEHDFVIGALISDQSADTVTFAPLDNAFLPVGNFYQWDGVFPEPNWSNESSIAEAMDTEQKGVYGATRIHLSDAFKVIVGGRIASWQRTGVSYDTVTDFGDTGVFIPYAGALYDLNQTYRIYASYTEIFQPQNAQDRNGDYLAPKEGKSYEIGLKSTHLNDRLHTSFALFRIDQDNLGQTDVGYIVPGTVNTQAQYAAQGTVSEGFEIEIVGEPIDGWNINAGYTQFNAEDAGGTEVNADHPRKQFKLFTTYNLLDLLPALTIGGGLNWQDDTYSENGTIRIDQDAYTVVNLMAKYAINERTQVQLNLNNLLDEKYYSQIGFFDQYRYGAPKNVTLNLQYHF
ncbi:TonB-dependent siderophore receptor [Paraglaciecola hydrolytica]|uniref:Porin n=1 Tax=Paraglaciecola hydrolytica TaxID=1799789 RepID=A0A136A4B1_9ALTE|nr:TonB-dependent siderophore receptor [Paraglaciecola hydrolytica]KXI30073.1 porin [Paraglaciecola hydrolytica]